MRGAVDEDSDANADADASDNGASDENEEEDNNGDTAESSAPAESKSNFVFTPYGAISGGHNSNFDEEVHGEQTAFQRYDAGATLTYDKDGTFVEFDVQGTFIDAMELLDPNRWDYVARFDASIEHSESFTSFYGFERVHDALEDPETITNEIEAGFKQTGATTSLRLKASTEHETNLTPDDDFGFSLPAEFDFIKTSLDAKFQINTQGLISPFVRAIASHISYPQQDITIINRNADEIALVAGVSLKPSDKLRFDIGGRYNHRRIDDLLIPRHSSGFVDARLRWKPSDKFALNAKVTRELDEPGSEDSVVSDETKYEVELELRPNDKIGLDLAASYEKEEEIGQDETEWEREVTAKVFYRVVDHLRLFAEGSMLWNTTDILDAPTEKYTRAEIRAGIETDF